MIRTQDLRLGNLIKFKALNPDDEEIEYRGEVTAIRKDSVTMNDHLHIPEQFILPVPLTEELIKQAKLDEWLEIGENNYAVSLQLSLGDEDREYYMLFRNGGGIAEVKHLHHLQNLIKDLTGEQLTLNN